MQVDSDTQWLSCEVCLATIEVKSEDQQLRCPRCHSALHHRKPGGVAISIAWTLSATLMLFPANLLPMVSVGYFSSPEPSTIMQGVLDLIDEGMPELAVIIFVASFVVPIAKLLVLAILIYTVKTSRPGLAPIRRTRLYFMTELIGRWSMVDVFVVAILFGLVQFGVLASVYIEAGAFCFAAVVIMTIFAAESFDPRHLWDSHRR